ncbi:VCBS repeat-containing protein [Candidatus Gottesmanbacteria bacterium]|nr:VCBS repeat-containing protein [Candidatus Gottesmanbacteria bacterium]
MVRKHTHSPLRTPANMFQKIIPILSLIVLFFVVYLGITGFILYHRDLILTQKIDRYKKSETRHSDVPSRYNAITAMEIVKKENFSPTIASRFYAYVVSVYADVLSSTNDETQAALSTSEFLNMIAPKHQAYISERLNALVPHPPQITDKAQVILDSYNKRLTEDNFSLATEIVPPVNRDTGWYVRQSMIDKGAKAGDWKPWVINADDSLEITPKPPNRGSFTDRYELAKVEFATKKRTKSDIDSIYFWHGATGFIKGQAGDNVTPTGAWLNILYEELGKTVDNREFARMQKILAQSIADSFITTWKVKYTYWTQRPSMRIPLHDLAVADPPFPSYISGHSTISHTASTVLSYLYPSKRMLWTALAHDAKNSRLLAGIHFGIDNDVGEYIGTLVGNKVISKISDTKLANKPFPSLLPFQMVPEYILLRLGVLYLKIKEILIGIITEYSVPAPRTKYKNITTSAGIDRKVGDNGVSWGDYNGDGYDDLLIINTNKQGNRLYRNNKDGTFTNVAREAGIRSDIFGKVGVFGDYDNDGCEDLYIAVGNYTYQNENQDILYHNNCNGTFTDVTQQAGIKDSYHGSGASWVDYDNDGYLDLYVANFGQKIGNNWNAEPGLLYHNNKNGTFTEVAMSAGVTEGAKVTSIDAHFVDGKDNRLRTGLSHQGVWFDYNNDGFQDLFVATDRGVSPLYKNNGNGTFTDSTIATDVTEQAGLNFGGTNMGVAIGDYDNNGYLDIYTTNYADNYLWKNNGNGTFTEVGAQTHTADASAIGWGTAFLDGDNDGNLDIAVANGAVAETLLSPERTFTTSIDSYFQNNGDGTFGRVTKRAGLENNFVSRGLAVSDFDHDGFPDLIISNEEKPDALFHNLGNHNHWLEVKLEGTVSNRDAIGARLTLVANGKTQIREVSSGSSYASQNSLVQMFGIGKETNVSSLTIRWPSGKTTIKENITADQLIHITEK